MTQREKYNLTVWFKETIFLCHC